uniref:NECAP PHear domain-containing protein n=1 Tax=Chlamydomonas euryale TaxID=1486919 RepID=A0A7R9V748_9CHLO|mmetsp:Transcript_21922/g.65578  ORF Transcript_21922/g.65578 Transcript_21922/m.65578 type:complete len:239 (+) Transcript_21922:367-1083(+)
MAAASADAGDDEIEQTLHVAANVCLFRIPPRHPTGHVSGDWRLSDKIFVGQLRIVARGETCHVRFVDTASGELFAECPVPYGTRLQYIEPSVDSSRNFVVRVEDAASGNHAFLGMGFAERSDSFDFNEALLRHEKQVERERATALLFAQGGGTPPRAGTASSSAAAPPAAAAISDIGCLYARGEDLRLKEGETMHVRINKKAHKPGGLMSQAAPTLGLGVPPPSPGGGSGFRLAPPPP